MNRQLANALVAIVLGFVFGWGIGAYIAWDGNPGHWSQNGRFLDAIVVAAACLLIFVGLGAPERRRRRLQRSEPMVREKASS